MCCLLIGKSGSGKSTLAETLIEKFGQKKVYVLNSSQPEKHEKISWAEAEEISNCSLIVEDLVSCTQKQLATLQKMLHVKNHHDRVSPILLVTHTATKNGICGIFEGITHTFFTAAKCNLPSLNFVLKTFSYSKEEKEEIKKKFLSNTQRFNHQVLLSLERKFVPASEILRTNEKEQSHSKIQPSNTKFLKLLPKPDIALSLYELIEQQLPKKMLNKATLTAKLRDRKEQAVVSVNLIDYISLALKPGKKRPEKKFLLFHKYLVNKIDLPQQFIENKFFWKVVQPEKKQRKGARKKPESS